MTEPILTAVPIPDGPAQQPIVLTITLDPAGGGAVKVSGPLQNQILCYGLLEMARDVIQKAPVAAL